MKKTQNVVQKILSKHLVEGNPAADSEIGIRIDQTLTQDATGTMAYLQFESMDVPRVKTDISVSYVDHNTVQIGFENADDHDFLQSVAKKYGIVYSKCGNGICHQLHLERFGKPGTTLLGSDSHTPTGGGIGQIAIGAGGIDIAVAMAGGAFHIPSPKVRAIVLKGKLRKGVSAKDVILKVLEKYGTKGNVGWIFEYTGPGVATLDVPSRATITNMGAELGVTTSVFPSDKVTKQFLVAQGRAKDFTEIVADKGAAYDDTFIVDLSKLEPLMAAPHSPGNIVTVKSMKGTKVNQIMIGSCTNSSYRDIRTVALYLKGKHVADDVEVGIACGSRQVINMLAKDGSLAILHAAGCRMLENACGFCIGAHMSPRTGAISLRTNNRNFEGRSGTKSAQIYLVSPETAAASALTGKVELPTKNPVAAVPSPKKFPIDDAMFLYRKTAGKGVKGTEIVRGPNIATVPKGVPLAKDLKGVAAIKVGDKITTDHIMPAGARLKFRSNIPQYAKFVFEPCDPKFHDNCMANREKGLANVIVAGESYGQGSSREHAALCPMYLGVKAVIAKSIERIHRANLINFGIVPFTFVNPKDYDKVSAGDKLELSGVRAAVEGDGKIQVKVKGEGEERTFSAITSLSDREKHLILCGGLLASQSMRRGSVRSVLCRVRASVVLPLVLTAFCGFAESPQSPARIAEIMAMLDDEPGFPQVRIDRREFWDKAPAEWIGEAERIVAAGVSRPSEEGYTEVRTNIGQVGREVESLFRAECRENKGRFLPAIRTCIDGLCKARTWVNPYHDRPSFGNFHGKYRSIELNCSEVAFKLAMGLDWLKGRLPDEDVTRAMSALDLHIVQPYLRSARTGDYSHHGWFLGNNNWNVACHWQSCCVALSVIKDKRVRAEFIEAAERAAPYYLRGFSKEGYCQEGLDYWNYGFSEFLRLTHLLYNATKGGVNLSKLPKAKDCFLAPYLFQLANGCAPQFNDGTASVPSAKTLYYGEFFWPEAHTAATKGVNPFSCGWCGYALIGVRPVEAWWPPRWDGQPYKLPIRSFFKDAQILLVRPFEESADSLSACLKGGNNGVPHNHNDLGQFIVALGSTQMVQDPAGKVYDLETFTAKRYNHPMLNSYGHAVPVIDGTLQAAGEKRMSRVVRTSFSDELDTIAMDLTDAYTNSILRSLVREMDYRRPEGTVEIADRAEYVRAGRFETPLSTYGKIERLGENNFVIVRETKNGVKRLAFTVDTQGAKWHVKEEKIPNPKRTEPTRWAVVLDEPATDFNVKFTFYRPVRAQGSVRD